MSSKPVRRARERGLTLIELILFIMIVGVALAGILGVLSLTTKHSADPLRRKQALMIAEGLLEEVQLARFSYCDPTSPNAEDEDVGSPGDCALAENWGPEAGGVRPHDNINDYVAQPNLPAAAFDIGGVLSDANGDAMQVDGYTARVTVTPQSIGGIPVAPGAGADVDVLRIRVEVGYDGDKVVLDGYRTRYAPGLL
ncbi:type II secretion system protein [Massilia niastensis]|uniref:type II secretion system protein n=1 Tax=Massilia niastensis TaxID=544911 RepID=UPI0003678EAB|nr:type II secretion system protein [Massilia niastensis]